MTFSGSQAGSGSFTCGNGRAGITWTGNPTGAIDPMVAAGRGIEDRGTRGVARAPRPVPARYPHVNEPAPACEPENVTRDSWRRGQIVSKLTT